MGMLSTDSFIPKANSPADPGTSNEVKAHHQQLNVSDSDVQQMYSTNGLKI